MCRSKASSLRRWTGIDTHEDVDAVADSGASSQVPMPNILRGSAFSSGVRSSSRKWTRACTPTPAPTLSA